MLERVRYAGVPVEERRHPCPDRSGFARISPGSARMGAHASLRAGRAHPARIWSAPPRRFGLERLHPCVRVARIFARICSAPRRRFAIQPPLRPRRSLLTTMGPATST